MKNKNSKITNLRDELYRNYKPENSTNALKKWYKKIIKESKVKVKIIPLKKCKKWKFTKNGVMKHDSGSFYKVEGVRFLNHLIEKLIILGINQCLLSQDLTEVYLVY